MRVLCLLALFGATLSGCCSTHRAWSDGYNACVPECQDCAPARHKSCLFQKTSTRCRCAHCSPCGVASDFGGGDCGSGCGSTLGSECGGCSHCAQGQMDYEGSMYSMYPSMPSPSTCPTCHQPQMSPTQSVPSSSSPMAPTVAPPATPENPPPMAPEPHQARMLQPLPQMPARFSPQSFATRPMQPLQLPPAQAQAVQHQEWQPPPSVPQSDVHYNPPVPPVQQVPQQSLVPQQSQTAVQPVLWVPPQAPAPLLMPAQ